MNPLIPFQESSLGKLLACGNPNNFNFEHLVGRDRAIQSQTSTWFSNANNITWNDVWNTQPKWRKKNHKFNFFFFFFKFFHMQVRLLRLMSALLTHYREWGNKLFPTSHEATGNLMKPKSKSEDTT
jgi:hypothetical protein